MIDTMLTLLFIITRLYNYHLEYLSINHTMAIHGLSFDGLVVLDTYMVYTHVWYCVLACNPQPFPLLYSWTENYQFRGSPLAAPGLADDFAGWFRGSMRTRLHHVDLAPHTPRVARRPTAWATCTLAFARKAWAAVTVTSAQGLGTAGAHHGWGWAVAGWWLLMMSWWWVDG